VLVLCVDVAADDDTKAATAFLASTPAAAVDKASDVAAGFVVDAVPNF
jgi:hypothetical protein